MRADAASQDTVGTMAAVNYVNGLIEEEVHLAAQRRVGFRKASGLKNDTVKYLCTTLSRGPAHLRRGS